MDEYVCIGQTAGMSGGGMPTSACRHGLVRDGGCARGMHFHIEEESTSYFSWWNVVLIGVGLALALLVYLPLNFANGGAYLRTTDAWWVHYIITPLIVTSCVMGLSVAFTSQALFAHGIDQMIEDDERARIDRATRSPADAHAVSIQVPALQQFMHQNVMVHIVPGAIAAVVLLVLATGSLHGADVRTVVLSTLLMCAVMWVAYYATPVRGFRDGKTYVGWDKLVHVYSNPSPIVLASHCAFAVACATLIPYFIINRDSHTGAGTAPVLHGGGGGQESGVPSLSSIVQLIRAGAGTGTGTGIGTGGAITHALPSLPL